MGRNVNKTCAECNYSTKDKSNMKRHMKKHEKKHEKKISKSNGGMLYNDVTKEMQDFNRKKEISNIESSSIKNTAQENERKNMKWALPLQYSAYIPNSELRKLSLRDLIDLILKERVEAKEKEILIMKSREREKESIALIQELVEEQRILIEKLNEKMEKKKRKGLGEYNWLEEGENKTKKKKFSKFC